MTEYFKRLLTTQAFSPQTLQAAIRKEKAERSLSEFIRQAWPIIESGNRYIHNWHIDYIAEYLQAVNDGQLRRVIFNIPPREMKSIEITICYPAWTWTRQPEKRFIRISYSDLLSRDHNIKSRDIITSDWYLGNWGDRVQLKDDVNRQAEYHNERNGIMFSTSVGGSLTGKGGDVIILDDPQDPQRANSETERQRALDFFTGSLQSRLNNAKTGAFIVVMQRLHEKDLTGYILSQELGYEHVCLPAIAEKRTVVHFPISGRELVREEGELLDKGRFDKASLDGTKKAMGSLQFAGQYQQRPAPPEGAVFMRGWLGKRFDAAEPPYMPLLIESWDMAFTKSEGSAKVAGFVLGKAGSAIYVRDLVNRKMTFTESVKAVRALSAKWPLASAKVVENKANGYAVMDVLASEIPGMVEFSPKGGKEERALSVTPYFEAGNIWFPDPATADWDVEALIADLLTFPNGQYKDTVDALVQGILYLMAKPAASPPPAELTVPAHSSYWRASP